MTWRNRLLLLALAHVAVFAAACAVTRAVGIAYLKRKCPQ